MNTDKIIQLADHIAQLSNEDWDLSKVNKCIAGHAVELWGYNDDGYSIFNSAAKHLGIDPGVALNQLFVPVQAPGHRDFYDVTSRSPFQATQKEAATVLRHLAKHGVVDWSSCVWHDA